MAMPLDLSLLARAVARLEEGLADHLASPAYEQLRDGLIQRFEFTFDIAHKTLRRALEQAAGAPDEVDRMTFPTLIRSADELGLLPEGWPRWGAFRDMRNITSHTYDEAKALTVVAAIPAFLNEAKALLVRLQERVWD